MTPRHYLKLMVKPLLLIAIVPAGYGVLMMLAGGDFFGMPLGLFMGLLALLLTAILGGGILGVSALAVWQPTFRRTLLLGFGLPPAAMALLWLAGAIDRYDFRDYTLLALVLLSPLVLGAGAVHGVDGRRLLRWESILLGPVALPLLVGLPRWAMPLGWDVPPVFLAAPVLAAGILGAWLYWQLPGEPPSRRRRLQEGATALALLVMVSVGVRLLPGRVLSAQQALAVATFRTRHPEMQLASPQIYPSQRQTIVELPADGWTYRVTLEDGQVVDDGYGQRDAARAAADYLERAGRGFLPIQPQAVARYTIWTEDRIPFPGAFEVTVEMDERYRPFVKLLVYAGQVMQEVRPGQSILSGPLEPAQVAELINGRTGPYGGVKYYDIRFAWQHADGVWEYGYREGRSFGAVLVRDGQLIDLRQGLSREQWAPPH